MSRRRQAMSDARAERVLLEVMQLSLTVREEGPDAVVKQLDRVGRAAGGDLRAALVVAAALVDPDRPVQRWWQRVIPPRPDGQQRPARPPRRLQVVDPPVVSPPRELRPCGTHAAFVRHRSRGEVVDDACAVAERDYQRARGRGRRGSVAS